jgi:hypothetical protein
MTAKLPKSRIGVLDFLKVDKNFFKHKKRPVVKNLAYRSLFKVKILELGNVMYELRVVDKRVSIPLSI